MDLFYPSKVQKALCFPRLFQILYILLKILTQASGKYKVKTISKSCDPETVICCISENIFSETFLCPHTLTLFIETNTQNPEGGETDARLRPVVDAP